MLLVGVVGIKKRIVGEERGRGEEN